MADRYTQLVDTPVGRIVAKQVGLPAPVPLVRYRPGQPVLEGQVLLGGAPGGRLHGALTAVLAETPAEVVTPPANGRSHSALIFDASAIADPVGLRELHAFFHPAIRSLLSCGRVLVLGTPPQAAETPSQAIAQRALEGFTRSLAKELRRGATAQLVYVAPGGEQQLASTLRFLLSPRSAYVSGQVVRVGTAAGPPPPLDWERPLADRVALVTGAARGIGAAIAATLTREGAHVVGLDVPAAGYDLEGTMGPLGGSALAFDITAADAPRAIADHLRAVHGGVDVVVHNAGITRDKTLGRMDEELWESVIDVNLRAAQRITDALIEQAGPGQATPVQATPEQATPVQAAPEQAHSEQAHSEQAHSEQAHSEQAHSEQAHSEQAHSEQAHSEQAHPGQIPPEQARPELGEHTVLRPGGRVICVSSISGIAGNAGQSNYATSKAGVIGLVDAYAPLMAAQGATINAVAPGFIETQMTARMPFALREVGRRMSSLAQGGVPVDVAETIAWLASPASGGVNGNVVRVCGQSLLGA
jgi:3-oxoacyl-[acyl-carrier protein] reductase